VKCRDKYRYVFAAAEWLARVNGSAFDKDRLTGFELKSLDRSVSTVREQSRPTTREWGAVTKQQNQRDLIRASIDMRRYAVAGAGIELVGRHVAG
jgi:hypothetical protein